MFLYFGSKGALAHQYPAPEHDRIIEPFAGSARYSLQYHLRDVWLNDLDPTIWRVWNYIINESTLQDLRSLPEPGVGVDIRSYTQLSQAEVDLLSLTAAYGSGKCYVVAPWVARDNQFQKLKRRLLWYKHRIAHWRVTNKDYRQIKINPKATWFIDPPYQGAAGKCYEVNTVNYRSLATWAKARQGQLLVCESEKANWLPFQKFKRVFTMSGYTHEYLFHRTG